MKLEQNVQVETSEYICLVKRIDGVVAQKTLETELIRCKDCRHFEADLEERTMYCANDMMPTVFVCTGQGFCSEAERKE